MSLLSYAIFLSVLDHYLGSMEFKTELNLNVTSFLCNPTHFLYFKTLSRKDPYIIDFKSFF